jgi:hypothetical protein
MEGEEGEGGQGGAKTVEGGERRRVQSGREEEGKRRERW